MRILILIIILFSLVCCTRNKNKPAFKQIDIKSYNEDGFHDTLINRKIDSANSYLQYLLQFYREKCFEWGLNKMFYDSMSFMREGELSVDMYISSSREFLIYAYKSKENKLTVHCSVLPTQIKILHPKIKFNGKMDELVSMLRRYDTTKAWLNYGKSAYVLVSSNSIYYPNYSWTLNSTGKFIGLFDMSGPVYFSGIKLIGNWKDSIIDSTYFIHHGIAMLLQSIEFDNTYNYGWTGGVALAAEDLQRLFFHSEYFREISANDKLAPIAREMAIKASKKEFDATYVYSEVEFKHDMKILQERIDSFNITFTAKELFDDISKQIRTGEVLWFYESYWGYTFQWLLVSLFFAVLAYVFQYFNLFYKKLGPWIDYITFFTFSVSIFTTGYLKRPLGLTLKYWIWPLLILLIIYAILFIWKKKQHSSN